MAKSRLGKKKKKNKSEHHIYFQPCFRSIWNELRQKHPSQTVPSALNSPNKKKGLTLYQKVHLEELLMASIFDKEI